MNLSDIGSKALQVLKTVAPMLATAVGGPFGPLAGAAISAALGTAPGDSKGAEAALLNATPDQLLALQKANQDFQVQMKQLGISEEKLTFDDLANARAMQVSTKDPTVRQLSWLNVGGFLLLTAFLIVASIVWPDQVAKVPATAWATLGTVFGYLAKSASQTEAFWFGSSSGSQAKDATLAELAKS